MARVERVDIAHETAYCACLLPPPDWTPVAGIYMSHHGTPRALLLYLEKPPTVGRNNQQLHLIKCTQVPEAIRRVVELHCEAQGAGQEATRDDTPWH